MFVAALAIACVVGLATGTAAGSFGASAQAAFPATTGSWGGPASPAAPTLTAGYRTVLVEWTAVADATSYDVQRSVGAGSFADLAANATSPYTDAELEDATVYGYRVRACNADGCSAYSSATTTTTAPAVPAGFSAGISGRTGVALWSVSAGADTYDVAIAGAGGVDAIADSFDRADSASALGTTSDGAQAWEAVSGTWGTVAGQAYLASNPAGAIATIDPGTPDGFVQFTLGADAQTGQGAVFRYRDSANHWYVTAAPMYASWRIDKVVDGVVTQVQTLGLSSTSAGTVVRVEFEHDTIRAYLGGNLHATVSDAALSGATGVGLRGGAGVTDAARWDDVVAGQLTVITTPVTGIGTTAYVDTALAGGTTYGFQARACNASACSAWTSSLGGTSSPVAPRLVATVASSTQVDLAWTRSTGATSYEHARRPAGGAWDTATATAGLSAVHAGLAAGPSYGCGGRGCRASACSPWTTAAATTTPGAGPGAPGLPSGTAGNTEALVQWAAPSSGGGAVSNYRVTVFNSSCGSPNNVTGPTTREVGSDARSFRFTGLSNSNSYKFKVEAYNGYDGGTWGTITACSNQVNPGTGGTVFSVPGSPTGVSATSGSGEVTVSWTPGSAGNAPATNYRVSVYSATSTAAVGVIAGSTAREVGSATTSYTFNGLQPGVSYTFRVEAANAVGWGPASAATAGVAVGY